MPYEKHSTPHCLHRRAFLGSSAVFLGGALVGPMISSVSGQENGKTSTTFLAQGKQFVFDTGVLRGTLRGGGRSLGLTPVVYEKSTTPIAGQYGLVSHYRLLDSENRFGPAGWDWTSTARVLKDGSVSVGWNADETHPFTMQADYRWASPTTLDVTTAVTARRRLRNFEVFLASYFAGFGRAFVYVKSPTATSTQPGFTEAIQAHGTWQMYPRDEQAKKLIGDGRWQRPPHPVAWQIMPQLAKPLAMRRDEPTGLVGLLMAPEKDCFAISTPYGAEGHRSLYLSLFGRDVAPGQTVTARARLIIGHDIDDQHAVELYQDYLQANSALQMGDKP